TQQARPWRKWLASWGGAPMSGEGKEADDNRPDLWSPKTMPWPAWPIETVIWPYPAKHGYGPGEPILWELKLLGDAADHGLFLELILPAMEAAATTSDERWYRPRTLWGRFEVQAVYAARGARWEPFVRDGRLDLDYRPAPNQWAEGLASQHATHASWRRLTWLTPFDFGIETDVRAAAGVTADDSRTLVPSPARGGEDVASLSRHRQGGEEEGAIFGSSGEDGVPAAAPATPSGKGPSSASPSIAHLLDALMVRLAGLLFGKWGTPEQVWALLSEEEKSALRQDVANVSPAQAELEEVSDAGPGRWIGSQAFRHLSPRLLSYLELAAAVHIGRHTHFGCGTFTLL
ncbi:MAG: hypothetical protein N2439_15070, partial [Anaerolineae bacterium]|nr:hypothetical protein [Anaerolineae bacterium]